MPVGTFPKTRNNKKTVERKKPQRTAQTGRRYSQSLSKGKGEDSSAKKKTKTTSQLLNGGKDHPFPAEKITHMRKKNGTHGSKCAKRG
jgi:hypothetical protein